MQTSFGILGSKVLAVALGAALGMGCAAAPVTTRTTGDSGALCAAVGDVDGDGVCDDADACEGDDAAGDTDADGVCDDADLCAGDDALGDADGDGVCDVPRPERWYVSANASGTAEGTSWNDAFRHPADALAVAQKGEEIWVSAGVYGPSVAAEPVVLTLVPAVRVYGGFAGDETTWEERGSFYANTVITGDFSGDDDTEDPSTLSDNATVLVFGASDAVFDGFRLRGNANAEGDSFALQTEYGMEIGNLSVVDSQGRGAIWTSTGDRGTLVARDVVVAGGRAIGLMIWSGTAEVTGYTALQVQNEGVHNYSSGLLTLAHASIWPASGHPAVGNEGLMELYNSALWSDGTSAITSTGGLVISGACANLDLPMQDGISAVNTVWLDGADATRGFPFVPHGERLYLSHAATEGVQSACVDAGNTDWVQLDDAAQRTTATDGTIDTGSPDAGASYRVPMAR